MGNCFSDPSSSKKHGQGQKLGSGPAPSTSTSTSNPPPPSTASRPPRNNDPPRTLGGTNGAVGGGVDDGDARDRALRAAEERANAAKKKGVHSSNPKSGQLSSKLEQERRAATSPPQNPNERMMDRGEWN